MTMQPFECDSCGREMETDTEYCVKCEEYIHGELYTPEHLNIYGNIYEREYEEPNPYHGTYSEE